MKRAAVAVIILTGLFFVACAKADLGSLMNDCEKSIKADIRSDSWKQRRDAWSLEVVASTKANDLSKLKNLLTEFESNISFAYQNDDWPAKRGDWLNKVSNAATLAQVRDALIECESSIKFESQDPNWKNKNRDKWIKRAQSLQ